MPQQVNGLERRTSADAVFDYLYERIGSLDLLPGAKISEAEIATKFGISRQPVRDAFSKLGNMDLLLIRPQKATVVKKFSLRSIATARFVRLSVEIEVLRMAALQWDGSMDDKLSSNLEDQKIALKRKDVEAFHSLDYDFHKLLCRSANSDFAFEIISQNKARVDRLCVLSLTAEDGMTDLIRDHETIIEQLRAKDTSGVSDTIRTHLSRLDDTVSAIHKKHASYFDNE